MTFGCQHTALQQLRGAYPRLFEDNDNQDMAKFLRGPQNQVTGFFAAVFEAAFRLHYKRKRM